MSCALLLWKILYLGAVWAALSFWGDMEEARFRGVMMHWPRDGGAVFASHFATWDGAHYLYLSEEGYGPGVRSNAFYPLYPLLMRWTSALTGGSHLIAGLVLANVFSLVGWVLFYEVARRRFGPEVALWATVFLVLFPGALFYQFVYTEGLFFLLVMLVWMGLERERYGWVFVGAFLLPMTRAIGLFVLLPIAWHLMTRRPLGWMVRLGTDRWDSQPRMEVRGDAAARPVSYLALCGLLLAPLAGWMVYLGLMWHWTGNPFDGFAAQRHWATHSIWNLVDVPKFVMTLFSPTEWHAYRGSILDRCLFIVLLYALPVIWRLGKDQVVWTYVLGILPAMSGMFTSYVRFEAVAFPLFLAVAAFFGRPGRGWALASALAVSFVLQAWLLWRFLNFQWAG
jgi:hypothetical protein